MVLSVDILLRLGWLCMFMDGVKLKKSHMIATTPEADQTNNENLLVP
jgi:hypothetical protein